MARLIGTVSAAFFVALTVTSAFAQNSSISTLTGPVTSAEISSFKSVLPGLVPGDSNSGNNYAYGNGGDAMEALGDMYDVTGDLAILDKLIQYCDKVVSIRNTTRVFWNGNKDPVWPNNATSTTWGAEQGDVAGHLAYAAQRISENPAIWDRTVGIGDPRGYGSTYRARANRYLSVVRETLNLYYQYFIKSDETMQSPCNDPTWPDANTACDAVPWNQQAMVTSAMIRGAYAYEKFGSTTPDIARWRATTRASLSRFIVQCKNFQYTSGGKTYYKWSYSGGFFAPGAPIRFIEDTGHGGYDIVGYWRGINLGNVGASSAEALVLANTHMDIIREGTQWWSKVDGTGTLKASLGNTWTYLSQFRSDVFGATVKTGPQYYADAARKLWIKQARHVGWKPSLRPTSATPTPTPTPGAGSTKYETEALVVTASSGDTTAINSESGASGGQYVMYSSNAVGDSIRFRLPNVSPGSYTVTVGFKRYTPRATVQTVVGAEGGTLGNLGAPIDMYGSSAFTSATVGTWNIGTTGNKTVELRVTGRNASSSGYSMAIDYVTLTAQ